MTRNRVGPLVAVKGSRERLNEAQQEAHKSAFRSIEKRYTHSTAMAEWKAMRCQSDDEGGRKQRPLSNAERQKKGRRSSAARSVGRNASSAKGAPQKQAEEVIEKCGQKSAASQRNFGKMYLTKEEG